MLELGRYSRARYDVGMMMQHGGFFLHPSFLADLCLSYRLGRWYESSLVLSTLSVVWILQNGDYCSLVQSIFLFPNLAAHIGLDGSIAMTVS